MRTKLVHAPPFAYLFGGSPASLLARGFSGSSSGTHLIFGEEPVPRA